MALALLGVLGACSVLASGLPRGAAWLVAIAALLDGARAARREGMRRCVRVTWGADGGLFVGAEPVQVPRVQWRGGLVLLRWRDGRGRRNALAWWPDTLPAARRRELRLAAERAATAGAATSMAP